MKCYFYPISKSLTTFTQILNCANEYCRLIDLNIDVQTLSNGCFCFHCNPAKKHIKDMMWNACYMESNKKTL